MTLRNLSRSPRTWLLVVIGLVLAVAGCAQDAPQDALNPAGPNARMIHNLFVPVFWVAVVVFVLVEAAIIMAVVKFRRRGVDDDEVPRQVHGNTRLEIGWTILPAVILAVIAIPTVATIFTLNERPSEALNVHVVGAQFWWQFEYEDEGIVTANELHIPTGTPVFLTLESVDVVHSFWSPRLNGKRDVVPGRTHTWSIEADEPGEYLGQCAEMCGISHANMRLNVIAHDPADYDEWVAGQQQLPEAPTAGLAADGAELFGQQCAQCHVVRGQHERVEDTSPLSPDLTHLMTRECFAGCVYDLNRNELEAWLRNPQRKAGSLMVIGELTEEQIDQLYAYLETLQ
jgi:cytochrome c oxidase subunit II